MEVKQKEIVRPGNFVSAENFFNYFFRTPIFKFSPTLVAVAHSHIPSS